MTVQYFAYGEKETEYLKAKDRKLGAVIDAVGHIDCLIDPDLFYSIVHQIVGQQISVKALDTIWERFVKKLGTIDAGTISGADTDCLKSLGISSRKAAYIKDFAAKVTDGSFDLEGLWALPDAEVIRRLISLKGVGVWTAEMTLLFGMHRPDVLSYDDIALRRGMCLLYHHKNVSRELFERYRRRYHPYGTVASLYLWAVAGGQDYKIFQKSPNTTA